MAKLTDLVQGTLDRETLALQPIHGWEVAQRVRQVSNGLAGEPRGAVSRAASPRATRVDSGQ